MDLNERALTGGELRNICRSFDPEELLDRESKAFSEAGLAYMVYDPIKEVLKNPVLLKTPIVRFGREVTLGPQPGLWGSWLER